MDADLCPETRVRRPRYFLTGRASAGGEKGMYV